MKICYKPDSGSVTGYKRPLDCKEIMKPMTPAQKKAFKLGIRIGLNYAQDAIRHRSDAQYILNTIHAITVQDAIKFGKMEL